MGPDDNTVARAAPATVIGNVCNSTRVVVPHSKGGEKRGVGKGKRKRSGIGA